MWEGLDNAAWGSHVYFETVSRFNQIRLAKGDSWLSKPITLTKFGMADWRPNMSAVIAQESPAQHRFSVWWTGDGVSLQASVESLGLAGCATTAADAAAARQRVEALIPQALGALKECAQASL